MKCEIERMEINYTFYFFAFFEKVIKKLLTFCYWDYYENSFVEYMSFFNISDNSDPDRRISCINIFEM